MTFDPIRPASADPSTSAAPEPFTPAPPEPAGIATSPVTPAAPGAATPAIPAGRKTGRRLDAVLLLAAAVAIGGVAFAIGRGTAPASAAGTGQIITGGTGFPTGSFAPGANRVPGGGISIAGPDGGGLTLRGTVESVDGDTITIKTASGQTIELKTDADTDYHTQAPASASDVTAGSSVEVQVQFDGAGGFGRPGASPTTSGPVGTAGSVTVVP
jgi:hypothetical protein